MIDLIMVMVIVFMIIKLKMEAKWTRMNTIYCYTFSAWVLKYYRYNIDYKQWVIHFIFKNCYFYSSYRGIKTCLVFFFYTCTVIIVDVYSAWLKIFLDVKLIWLLLLPYFFINSFHVGMWLWKFVKFLYIERWNVVQLSYIKIFKNNYYNL